MIVLVDTTVLHRDVHAARPFFSAILERASAGDWKVLTPRVVLEEAVRQFPERLRAAEKTIREHRGNFGALGLVLPEVPDIEAEVAKYEPALRARLTSTGCSIVEHPPGTEVVGTWAATHRKPFQEDGTGTVDAFVWLTALECAHRDRVILITANTRDFTDPDDPQRPAFALREDLEARGVNPARVQLVPDVPTFFRTFIQPVQQATDRANQLLADDHRRSRLISKISLATSWFGDTAGEPDQWQFGFDIDSDGFQLVAFDATDLQLQSVSEGANGVLYLALLAEGAASFDFLVEKYELNKMSSDAPVRIIDGDWNDWFALVSGSLPARAEIEVRVRPNDEFDISIDNVKRA